MREVDLMRLYPRSPNRAAQRSAVTEEDRRISKQFGQDYFDGDRRHGYGGYFYHERFWMETVRVVRDHYRLSAHTSILDVGCAKGFMLYDFQKLLPQARLVGIDISEYAIKNSIDQIKPFVKVGDARALPFPDCSFDLVMAINTIHNLPYEECKQSLREIQRVSKQYAFVMVDAYRTEEEHQALLRWVLTAETVLHVDDWVRLFTEAGYTHDYSWWTV